MHSLNAHQLTWYVEEICMHSEGARLQFSQLLTLVDDLETRQSRRVWTHLSTFLHHAAMISKFLDPGSKKGIASVRGISLKKSLNINYQSEVFSREARDNVEHIDERMDGWIGAEVQQIIEMVLDDRDGYEYIRANEKRVKRILIADELVFVSERKNNTKFELKLHPLNEEIIRIGQAADTWIRGSSPYARLP